MRNAFYGLRLSQLLRLPRVVRPFAAHWVIDETTAVALAQRGHGAPPASASPSPGVSLYVLWNLTTLLGALGAEALGDTDAWGLDAAGPAVFLALLAPMLIPARSGPSPGSPSCWASVCCRCCPPVSRSWSPRWPRPPSSGARRAPQGRERSEMQGTTVRRRAAGEGGVR